MAERRDQSTNLTGLKSATTQQIEQLRATTSGLRQLRENLWAEVPPPPELPPDVS